MILFLRMLYYLLDEVVSQKSNFLSINKTINIDFGNCYRKRQYYFCITNVPLFLDKAFMMGYLHLFYVISMFSLKNMPWKTDHNAWQGKRIFEVMQVTNLFLQVLSFSIPLQPLSFKFYFGVLKGKFTRSKENTWNTFATQNTTLQLRILLQ